jgi:hypothetical protein
VGIDRDNFRHLTGFGRDVAGYVDAVLDKLSAMDPRTIIDRQVGNAIVHLRDDGSVTYRFMPLNQEQTRDTPGRSAYESAVIDTTLGVFVDRNGFREITALPMYLVTNPEYFGHYHIYQHAFLNDQNGDRIVAAKYTGVTKRGWRIRWAEHLRAANAGSHYRFHKAIKQWQGTATVTMHHIIAHAASEQKAMDQEERIIARDSLYPLGLNMIPGGNAGLAYLRRIGALGKNERVSPDDVQQIINRFFESMSRKGLPNPLAAANWLDPSYAEKVICSGPDRLTAQQIRDIRFLSSLGHDVDIVKERAGARNPEQVRRVLSGSTYSRIL